MSSGIYIQTPQFAEYKAEKTQRRIGKHILVGISFPNGAVFGKTFNRRSHEERQWVWKLGDGMNIIAAAIGDFADISLMRGGMQASEMAIADIVTDRYVSCVAMAKAAASVCVGYLDGMRNLALELVLADLRKNLFFMVNSGGDVRKFADFVVVGADVYTPVQEVSSFSPKEQAALVGASNDEETNCALRARFAKLNEFGSQFCRKPAVKYLEHECNKLPFERRSRNDTVSMVQQTLFDFDPPSQSGQFELVFFEKQEDADGVHTMFYNLIVEPDAATADNRKKRFAVPADIVTADSVPECNGPEWNVCPDDDTEID